jgi:hypothetical protein
MSVSEMFSEFIGNLAISNTGVISTRYGEITSALNKHFRETESKTANTLQVGSFGRKTGINGISDLDMLYIIPRTKWDSYNKSGGQLKLLQDAKEAILKRYPSTKVKVDRLVVTVTYTNFHVEVQPVFEQEDGSFKYPDTSKNGCWKITKPKEEMTAIADMDSAKNSNLRRLCKMARAWKNKHGVAMGGLLIDTLAYNFLASTTEYDSRSYLYYDWLSRDFFKYLSELPEQSKYSAPGSRQDVKVKKSFLRKAKKAYEFCLEAIKAENNKNVNDKWKKVYGRPFPSAVADTTESRSFSDTWRNTEEFIEDRFDIDIREYLKIDCEVKQNGFREYLLSEKLSSWFKLGVNKSLRFTVTELSAQEPYQIYWKVLNRGEVARKRDMIRGQIESDFGNKEKTESTSFRGEHIVECFCVKDNVVVAKDRILVPIGSEGNEDD